MMDNVDFHSIGGLEENVEYLMGAILLPLINRDVFKKFHVKPPRGILFHGPPGTGKTLTAASLANECKRNKKKVSFFHQNAAECLSMWMGQSEKNLRDLFTTAQFNSPAIIFFDELDALAPIRSKRMDHVHCSVVSTLLTLMDGLKSALDVVVIGATNRLDEIDPALRRPGRFDKELFFPPPDLKARRAILNIHTRHWHICTSISSEFIDHLAEQTAGYCGADLQALCREAFMCAMKRSTYPGQRTSVKSVKVGEEDFIIAKSKFVPCLYRTSISPARSLSKVICPLLQGSVRSLMLQLERDYPFRFIFPKHRLERRDNTLFCPRVLLTGSADQGLTSHVAPAVLHRLEHLPVHVFDVTTLSANSNSSDFSCIEVALSKRLRAVRFMQPCIMYLPDITEWWSMIDDLARSIFLRMVNYFDSDTDVLLLATAHLPYSELTDSLKEIFNKDVSLIITMTNPTEQERNKFFEPLFERMMICPSKNLWKTNYSTDGVSAEDAEASPAMLKGSSSMPIQTRSSRICWSQDSMEQVSLDDLRDLHAPLRGKKRRLHESNHHTKKARTEPPEQNTFSGLSYETSTHGDSSLAEGERLPCANPTEGCKFLQKEKIHQLLQRLVKATENSTVHCLEVLYTRIIMATRKHRFATNCSYLEKDLEHIVIQSERENSQAAE